MNQEARAPPAHSSTTPVTEPVGPFHPACTRSERAFKQACAFGKPTKSLQTFLRTWDFPRRSRTFPANLDAADPIAFHARLQRSRSICSRNRTGSYRFPRTHGPLVKADDLNVLYINGRFSSRLGGRSRNLQYDTPAADDFINCYISKELGGSSLTSRGGCHGTGRRARMSPNPQEHTGLLCRQPGVGCKPKGL